MRRVALAACLLLATAARAQDVEPRAFSNAPVGVNFLLGGYAYTRGALATDPKLQTSSAVLAFAHAFGVLGMSAKFDAALPFTWLSGTADLAGQPIERVVNGLGNARLRVSVNFYGAPPLAMPEFAASRQDLILGGSFAVFAPTGQYDPSRLINLGSNRWAFRPELGASKALGPLTLELMAGATFFTDNADFYGGHTRAQNPILSLQCHAIYSFGPSMRVLPPPSGAEPPAPTG